MELDFAKYCVVDRSPTTVLPAPRPHPKSANRKSNGKPKHGKDKLSLKEEFTEISFNRYRSASCRDARSERANKEGNEGMKRGSVYQCSKERMLLNRLDDVGRKKIEVSHESSSTLTAGIIDSLCGLDEEDSPLVDRNRSSVMSLAQQSSSYPTPPQNTSSSAKAKKKQSESAVASLDNSIKSREKDLVTILNKSLSAKLSLPHSPESDDSRISTPKGRLSPVRKRLDPFWKSKSHSSSCLSENRGEKKETINPNPQSSPAHLHGILKLENKHGMPFFEFSVKSPEDVYIAKTWKVDNALTWIYTFHSLHHRRKSNANGWGFKENNRDSTMIGQMLVSCYLRTELKGRGALNDSMVTEFVLHDIAHSRKSISSQDNSDHEIKVSHSQPLTADELNPEVETAAIVIQVPFEKRESLKFKSGDNKKTLPNLLELCKLEQANGDLSRSGTMHVVIPDGNHSFPSTESRGPSPLLDRWRLGGGCDCGGWDMACPLNIFGNPDLRIAEGDNHHSAQLFVQGIKDNIPAFTMRAIEEGKYKVDFHARLSSLQAFSICVSILHAAEASTAVGQERSKQMLQSDSLRVFAEEDVKNLIDAIAEEEKVKVNKKTQEVMPTFVLNPPFSPIARV